VSVTVPFLLDSDTCIRFLNGRSQSIERKLAGTTPSKIKLCSVVKAESLYGASRSNKHKVVLAKLDLFFAPYESFPFDDSAAVEYGRIRGALAEVGTPIGPNDLMIAAIALTRQLTLVTHNTREFSRVSGLLIEDWELP
jgi:tRNA(fMet)-specific endonuclease VapC